VSAIVLYDGTCVFCQKSVRFIAARDPERYFRFGASQSARGAELLEQFGGATESARSIILIEDSQIFIRSTATLRIARRLMFPWRLAGILLAVPRPLRDAVYRLVATIRHYIAGKSSVCEIPPPEILARMIPEPHVSNPDDAPRVEARLQA
jgi:predicted DCC family thiol-disulfide oxidoreductase YuxK